LRVSEMVVLAMLIIGLAMFSIGSILYLRELMLAYSVDVYLQLAVFGAYIIILALVLAKLLQKVME